MGDLPALFEESAADIRALIEVLGTRRTRARKMKVTGTGTAPCIERYYRDKDGWLKVSARGRVFRATAEQVLNHVLPALAGVKPSVRIVVQHDEQAPWRTDGLSDPGTV